MVLINDKKGAELSMNVVIIAILAILVLVLVAFFFTSGTGSLFDKIKDIFRSNVPDDISLAIQACESNCNNAQDLLSDNAKENSAYCSKTWNFDLDKDGRLDTEGDELRGFHCWETPISTSCPDVQSLCPEA